MHAFLLNCMQRCQRIREACQLVPYGLFNILSVVAIIVANKAVFKTVNFHFPTALMCIHATVTFMGLSVRISTACNCFIWNILPPFTFCTSCLVGRWHAFLDFLTAKTSIWDRAYSWPFRSYFTTWYA